MSLSDLELTAIFRSGNPTVYSVFMSGTLHKMNLWEAIVYLLIVITASIFNCICLAMIGRSTVFHSNLQVPIWWTAFSYFQLAASKVMTVLFQNIYLTEDNVVIGGLSMIPYMAFTHYHFIFTVMASPIVVTVERSLATILLSNYEKTKRRYILVILLLFQFLFGIVFTILTVTDYLRYVPAGIMAGSIALISFVVFCYINKINKDTLRYVETENRDIRFDLSVRYQLRENVKTFEMLKRLFLTLITLICIIAALKTIPMIMDVQESTKYAFREITDMMVHAGPIYITITLLWAVEDYRIQFFRLLGHEKRKISPTRLGTKTEERELYFEQFQLTWK